MDINPSQPAPSSQDQRKATSTVTAPSNNKNNKKKARNKPSQAPTPSAAVVATSPAISSEATPQDMRVEAVEELLIEDMTGMIATAAYYLAERRNFAPGHELEDWLEAEQQLRK